MPVTRNQLPSVAGFDRRLHIGDAIERASSRFSRWVLGAGFLAVDLALFGTSLLVAYTWALIAHPDSFASITPFRYWGIVAIVHTILTGGGLLAWKLLGMDEPATRTAIPAYGSPTSPAYAVSAWQPAPPVETVVAQPRTPGRAQGGRRVPWASRPVEQNWPHQPELLRTQPGAVVDPDLGEATWPESAPLSTSLGVSVSSAPDDINPDQVRPSPSQSWFDSFLGSRSAPQKDKEQRWSWVEAAAGSWLSRRESTAVPEDVDSAATDTVIPPDSESDQPQI